ncbi:MAG: Pnap_2097 family protein [Lentilitoribacter sp.]
MNKVTAFEKNQHRPVCRSTKIRLGMAELQPDGLSEQWFLKFSGDIHWSLIAEAMGQRHAVFEDVNGQEVYAAFCTTSLSLQPMTGLLAKDVIISSRIYQVNEHQIGSIHKMMLYGNFIASLFMISTFVSHGKERSNKSIIRNKYMPQLMLDDAPLSLVQLSENARNVAKKSSSEADSALHVSDIKPCRSLDFNAVGLLYFPSFSKFTERVEDYQQKTTGPLVKRDVVYLGNIDQGVSIGFYASGSDVYIKRDDGVLIAKASTQRR